MIFDRSTYFVTYLSAWDFVVFATDRGFVRYSSWRHVHRLAGGVNFLRLTKGERLEVRAIAALGWASLLLVRRQLLKSGDFTIGLRCSFDSTPVGVTVMQCCYWDRSATPPPVSSPQFRNHRGLIVFQQN